MDYENIKKSVYDINILISKLLSSPQTYKTILTSCCYKDGTLQLLLRRKLNNLHKDGLILKTIIPGTRFGEVIFYHPDKKYIILFEDVRVQINVYYIKKYKRISKFYIEVEEYNILDGWEWKNVKEKKVLFEGNLLKWV